MKYPVKHLPLPQLAPQMMTIVALSCLLGLAPTSAQQLLQENPIVLKGQALFEQGQGQHAKSVFQSYLKANPYSIEARLWLARLARREFEFTKAQAYLEAALTLQPERAETLAELAYLYYQWSVTPVGRQALYMAKADEVFQQAQAVGPENPWVLSYLAEFQLAQEDRISAEHNLQKVLRQYPTFIPAYQGLIRFYTVSGDVGRAKDTAIYATELDPDNAMTQYLIAQLMDRASRPAEAVKYARQSERLDFGRLPARDAFLAQRLEQLGELKEAASYYERLVAYADGYAPGWLKLGEIYERLASDDPTLESKSMTAYRKALSLDPGILTGMVDTARNSLRAERPSAGLPQWRKVLTLTQDAALQEEAIGALASLHDWNARNSASSRTADIQADLGRWDYYTPESPSARLLLDRIKLERALAKAQNPGGGIALTPDWLQRLNILGLNEPDPFAAGEAHFMLGEYGESRDALSLVDGLSAEEYAMLGDRLLLERALVFATVFYQRAYELKPSPTIETGLAKIKQKKASAERALQEGNLLFSSENYEAAMSKYHEAIAQYPEWETPYLRLADTEQELKHWPEALSAYETATALNPGLLDSEGFSKNLAKVRKRANK